MNVFQRATFYCLTLSTIQSVYFFTFTWSWISTWTFTRLFLSAWLALLPPLHIVLFILLLNYLPGGWGTSLVEIFNISSHMSPFSSIFLICVEQYFILCWNICSKVIGRTVNPTDVHTVLLRQTYDSLNSDVIIYFMLLKNCVPVTEVQ